MIFFGKREVDEEHKAGVFYLEECSCVVVGQLGEFVVTSDDDALLQEVSNSGDDFDWREIARMTFVDVENLLSVPDHSLKIARQDHLVVSGRENLSERLSVLAQLFPFALDLGNHLILKRGKE